MVVDFDDFHDGNHRLDLLRELKKANPLFRCTVFAIPGLCTWEFLESLPRWIELAVHGWLHPDPRECEEWTRETMEHVMNNKIVRVFFVNGFKAPGWQISDGCYEALLHRRWWVADQPYNDKRRPISLRVHRLGEDDHWHGHIQNECDNGLEETFDELVKKVEQASEFRFLSEVAW